jgi:soluble lytic murein transglycosylase-like protein
MKHSLTVKKITAAVLLTFIFIYPEQLQSRIKSRTGSDGSIEFYNTDDSVSPSHVAARHTFTDRYDRIIEPLSVELSIDPYLVKCIIKVESDFNSDAVSEAGAMGLMQLMQETAGYYGVTDPFDPEQNIRAGMKHFKVMMTALNNDVELALAAYHAGIGRVKRKMAVPPIKSTIAYVDRVLKYYTGKGTGGENIKKLYKRIDEDGDIIIFSK